MNNYIHCSHEGRVGCCVLGERECGNLKPKKCWRTNKISGGGNIHKRFDPQIFGQSTFLHPATPITNTLTYTISNYIYIIHTDTPEVEVASVSYLHRHEAWMRADGSSTGVDEEGSLYAFGIERIGLSADFGQQHVEIWGFQVTFIGFAMF